MNSKQVLSGAGVVALLVIVVYPALSTGHVSVFVGSSTIQNADHVYVTIISVWAHRAQQASSEGWELISNETKIIDLIAPQDSPTLLAKGQISVANYDSVRIEVLNVTWVFNKTSTSLQPFLSKVSTNTYFTVKTSGGSLITLMLTGRQEEVQRTVLMEGREEQEKTRYFMASLNATVNET